MDHDAKPPQRMKHKLVIDQKRFSLLELEDIPGSDVIALPLPNLN